MGGSGSTNSTDVASSSIIKVANDLSTSNNQSSSNTINIVGSTLTGATVSQKATATLQAIANLNITNDVINKMVAEMNQQASSASSALGVATANNSTSIKNAFTNILNNTFKTSVSQSIANSINITNSTLLNTKVTQSNDIAQKSVTQYLLSQKQWTDVANALDQSNDSSFSLLSVFGSASPMIWLGIIVLIFALLAWKAGAFKGSKSGGFPEDLEDFRHYYR